MNLKEATFPLATDQATLEFTQLLPEPGTPIDWADSVILRYRWFKDHLAEEQRRAWLFRELVISIVGDDATCFQHLSEASGAPDPRTWQIRLTKRVLWEIQELSHWPGGEHQDIVDLLVHALSAVTQEPWTSADICGEAEWTTARNQIADLEKVKAALRNPMSGEEKKILASWNQWRKASGYQFSSN